MLENGAVISYIPYPPNRTLTSALNEFPFGRSCASMLGCLLNRMSSVLFFIELCVPIAATSASRFIDIFRKRKEKVLLTSHVKKVTYGP